MDLIGGVVLALATGLFWAISPMCWSSIGRRIGAFPILVMARLAGTAVLLAIMVPYSWAVAVAVPSSGQLGWIAVSSFLGLVLGDMFLYQALVSLGPR